MVPKVETTQQTHSSAVLVPLQQADGTKVAVKLEDEYPGELEAVKREGVGFQSEESQFAPRIEVSQERSVPEARKNSVDKKETAKFAAIAATWYVCVRIF